jgi:hypothetical protein
MKAPFINNLPTQTNYVIVNPKNPVNPDSKPGVRGEFYICTGQKKVDAFTHRRKAVKKVIILILTFTFKPTTSSVILKIL